jgi:hypothetical protein
MKKIRIAMGALSIYVASLASTAVVSAASSPDLAARSAEELARYIAAGGHAVAC